MRIHSGNHTASVPVATAFGEHGGGKIEQAEAVMAAGPWLAHAIDHPGLQFLLECVS